MNDMQQYILDHQLNAMRLAGRKVGADRARERCIEVFNPFTEEVIGTVPKATLDEVRETFAAAHRYRPSLTRFERAAILNRAAAIISQRLDEVARLITAAAGLCIKDALYEAGRVSDVLLFGASECLKDDGQIFSCDLTPQGKKRRVYTQRGPLLGVITAITPFNHPMNQVAHKVVPSIASNNRMVLKPSEKVPFSAILFADILYEAGLPPECLSVITGDPREIADELISNEHVDLVTFTGGVAIGKYIAAKAGYRRMVLELGGNDPIIVMEDADIDEASTLAVQGSYKNSGQRCTAVKRMLVHSAVADEFVEQVVAKTIAWQYGDPMDQRNDMGTVIDEPAAMFFESRVNEALGQGASLRVGNLRRGALYSPTVLDHVLPAMRVAKEETFGPVAAVFKFKDEKQVVALANDTDFGLASYFYSRDIARVFRVAEALEYGMVGVNTGLISNEVAPFGGVKQSGLGREGSVYGIEEYLELKYICLGGIV